MIRPRPSVILGLIAFGLFIISVVMQKLTPLEAGANIGAGLIGLAAFGVACMAAWQFLTEWWASRRH